MLSSSYRRRSRWSGNGPCFSDRVTSLCAAALQAVAAPQTKLTLRYGMPKGRHQLSSAVKRQNTVLHRSVCAPSDPTS